VRTISITQGGASVKKGSRKGEGSIFCNLREGQVNFRLVGRGPRIGLTSIYSWRIAVSGSIRDARLAGT
jgi:hypothetical protein